MALRRGDLVGTRNGINVNFTIPLVLASGSEMIVFNGDTLYLVGAFSATPQKECIISGQDVTLGLAPNSGDRLYFIGDTP